MKKMVLHFDSGMIEKDWMCQKGTEWYPDLEKRREAVLKALGLPPLPEPVSIIMDFEAQTVELAFLGDDKSVQTISDMGKRESAVLKALDYEYVDMGNAVGLVEAFMNGMVSKKTFEMGMGIEGLRNEKNPLISEFLKRLEQQSGEGSE